MPSSAARINPHQVGSTRRMLKRRGGRASAHRVNTDERELARQCVQALCCAPASTKAWAASGGPSANASITSTRCRARMRCRRRASPPEGAVGGDVLLLRPPSRAFGCNRFLGGRGRLGEVPRRFVSFHRVRHHYAAVSASEREPTGCGTRPCRRFGRAPRVYF